MSGGLNEVLRLAMSLPEAERLELADELLASAPVESAPFAPEWLAEVKRRAARIDSGEGALRSWDEVRARACRRLAGGDDA